MAKLNWDKSNRQIKALNDVREALSENAFEDVFVIIDDTVPPKRKNASTKIQTTRKPRPKRVLATRTQQSKKQQTTNASAIKTSLASIAASELNHLLQQAAANTKDRRWMFSDIAEAIKHIETTKRFKSIKVPTKSNCIACPLTLRPGRNHYCLPSLRFLICANCVAQVKKLLAMAAKETAKQAVNQGQTAATVAKLTQVASNPIHVSSTTTTRPKQSLRADNIVQSQSQPNIEAYRFCDELKILLNSEVCTINPKPGISVQRNKDRVQVLVESDTVQRAMFSGTATEYGIMKALDFAQSCKKPKPRVTGKATAKPPAASTKEARRVNKKHNKSNR